MGNVAATEFKARCLELMDRVAERSESFVITKRGKPVARLVPVEKKARTSLLGALRGQAQENGDIVSPAVSREAWESAQEWDQLNREAPGRKSRRKVGSRR